MTDYVIVGGGSAGCVVAARLSEDPTARVTLLEEGPADSSPFIHLPATYYKTCQGDLVERYPWEPEPSNIGAISPVMVQARVLGGGSSVNGLVYVRGAASDYDEWNAAGATGWAFRDVLPYFIRAEANDRLSNALHGTQGPLGVSDPRYIHPLTLLWLQACQNSGLAWNDDFNGGTQDGCGLYQINTRQGRRSSTAVAYLRPARNRPNLDVRTGCRVLRILIDNGRATGVVYSRRGQLEEIRATKEVILCAGSINSPKLLLLSGIGPADELRSLGIEVQQDLPGVGRNLQDHLEVSLVNELHGNFSYDKYKKWYWQLAAGMQYVLFRSGPLVSNLVEGGAFFRTSHAAANPDVQIFFLPGAGIEEGVDTVPGGYGCTVNVCITRPKSVGFLTLRSANPTDFPVIRPNYLSESIDVERFAEGLKFARSVLASAPVADRIRREHVPSVPLRSDAEYHQYVRANAHAALHPVGTCRAGADALAVVDPSLRVRGIDGLRVADASIMPNLCSGNTNAAAIMIGEKASDHICGRLLPTPA